MIVLVTGPVRSGKSEWAEYLATRSARTVRYIATAAEYPDDPEWQARLLRHRQRRPPHWEFRHVPIDLAEAIADLPCDRCALVDALGTWIANLLDRDDGAWAEIEAQLLSAIARCPADAIFVGEEVGWGVVPAYELGRRFRDRLGGVCRQIGARADAVYLVTGGHALDLKKLGDRLPEA